MTHRDTGTVLIAGASGLVGTAGPVILATAISVDLATHSGRRSSQRDGNRTNRLTNDNTARDLLSFPEGQRKPRARPLRRPYTTRLLEDALYC